MTKFLLLVVRTYEDNYSEGQITGRWKGEQVNNIVQPAMTNPVSIIIETREPFPEIQQEQQQTYKHGRNGFCSTSEANDQ